AAKVEGEVSDEDRRLYVVDRSQEPPVTRVLRSGAPIHGWAPSVSGNGGLIAYRSTGTDPTVGLCALGTPAGTTGSCTLPVADKAWSIEQSSGPALSGDGRLLAWPLPPPAQEPVPVLNLAAPPAAAAAQP